MARTAQTTRRPRKLKPALGVPPYPKLGRPGVIGSVTHAWNGVIHTVVHQRNMRIHVTAAFLVSLVGSGIPLGLAEKVTLIFCVMMVFFAEILNSALEQLVDLATQEFDEKARIAKDAAAAGVLVLAIGTVVIFAALLVHNWDTIAAYQAAIQRQVALGVPFTVCGAALMLPFRRPLVADLLLFLGGSALLAALARHTESAVFSSMSLGLLIVTGAAALERRRLAARS